MNKDRRERLLYIGRLLDQAEETLRGCGEEEELYAESMPENFHGSDKHDCAVETADSINEMADELLNINQNITEIVES